ncbi:hypothetical protein CDL15_Pgr027243 [Punica granatum]|uniref:Uncharacterized protein n=1 Tax=Punica granatum TaxID=22663 RepID=A0A218Y3L7_PUNGR|nr:hypothetical protein CDL15_Pgr027243 [Punica granatum]
MNSNPGFDRGFLCRKSAGQNGVLTDRMHGRADTTDLQGARVSGLGELANGKRKDAQRCSPGIISRSTSERSRRTCDA